MPRNKSTKRTAKRQTANNILSNVIKMEKDLLATPAKLATQLDKEINAQKQKENKSIKALNKIKAAVANAEARSKDAQSKTTPTAKKQFKKFKKAYAVAIKMQAIADKQHQDISITLESLINKQSKLIEMNKYLNQFEKEWSKNSKKMHAKPKASKKSAKVKVTASRDQQPQIDRMEMLVDSTQVNEPTELAS